MSMIAQNTWRLAKDSAVYGIGGGLLGFGLGAGAHWIDGSSNPKDILYMGGLGALTGGIIGELAGMMWLNRQQGGTGLLVTPILGAGSAAGGMAYAKLKKNVTDVKTVMRYGVVGGLIGAPIGAGVDYLRNRM